MIGVGSQKRLSFACQLEREIITKDEISDGIINVIPSDAPCLHYETGDHIADYVLGLQKEVRDAHALYFNIFPPERGDV